MNNKRLPIESEILKTAFAQEAQNLLIDQIRQEYRKIDDDWLQVHFKISLWLVLFAIAVEIGISLFLVSSNYLTIATSSYFLKYVVVPACANLALIGIEAAAIRTERLSQYAKIYTVSLIFVALCFMLATVHSIFSATYYLFAIAVVLTTIYANYRVTCVTALTSIAATIIAELFIRWDPDKLSVFSNTRQFINFLLALFILAASSLVSIIQIRYEINKNEASIQKELERQLLHERVRTDELTGVFSRKALHDALRDIDTNPSKSNSILAIVDLDKFKGINDSLGHHTGDSYLVAFAKILKENNALADVFRYGGDEFCLLFHNDNMATAIETCQQLRQQLNALTFDECPELKLTASFGLATYADSITASRLFINADKAMYQAKKLESGICVYSPAGQNVQSETTLSSAPKLDV